MILHGLYGSSDNWLSIGKSLSGQFTVHLVDQRNHGRSPHDPVHTYQAMRDDLRDFLDQHDLWKVNLIGHSMGGKTAMFFAAAFPHRLSSLVIVDISPRSYKSLVSPSPQALSHLNIVQSLRNGTRHIRLKSFAGDDEAVLLKDFAEMINKFTSNREVDLCAHNGKEFDFPYIARRMLVNGLKLPRILDVAGKKPWEVKFLDTLELWKFGDFKNYTSLDLLAHLFGIPTPKDDIDGSMVSQVYWKEKNLNRIVEYCRKDVVTVARLLLRLKGEPMIADENIEIVD